MAIQSLFPPYPDPVVEPDRLMRRSWVGFFQGWIALWDALLLQVRDLEAAVAALLVNPVGPTIDVPYNPANFFTSDPTVSWAVTTAGQVTYQTKLVGDWLTVNICINTGTVSAPVSELRIPMPSGYVAAQASFGLGLLAYDTITGFIYAGGRYYVVKDGDYIAFYRGDGLAWIAAVTILSGAFSFQVKPV